MLAKESIKARVESEHGISFTEFSYMLLQANDYWHLHDSTRVELQIGGSDQWGNIVAGVDMIRRRSQAHVHAFTWPLMTTATGAKFGKSAGNAVWLAADRTSPYAFFQYWMNTDDRDVEKFLLQLTLLPVREIADLVSVHADAPQERRAQRRLAHEVTTLVHGADAAQAAAEASAVLFGGDPDVAGLAAWEVVAAEVETVGLPPGAAFAPGVDPVPLLVGASLAKSNNEARRLLRDGAVMATGRRIAEDELVTEVDLRHGRYVLLRKGRKSYAVVDVQKDSV